MRLMLLTLAFAGPLAACGDLGPAADEDGLLAEIAANRQKWEAWRPQVYVYDVEQVCFCAEEGRGPVRVWVTSGQVQARAYVSTGAAVASGLEAYFPGVEGLFDVLVEAVGRKAHQIQVTWDPATGAPVDFWIDYDPGLADEERGYRIVTAPHPPA